MPKPSPLAIAILALSLACVLVVTWFWQHGAAVPASAVATAPAPVTSAPAPALPTPARSADPRLALEPLLAALEQSLLRGDARPDEAVLTFKDDAALRAFLARAGAAGLTVVSRLDALRSLRVRYGSFDALRDELLAHGGDYDSLSANSLVGIPQRPLREERPDVEQIPFRNDTLAYLGATGDRSDWGRGVTIAVLDSGVGPDTTFGNGRLRTLDIGFGSSPGEGGSDGHGTSVAALAAGQSPDAAGVAPAANLLSIRVTDGSGMSDLYTLSQAIVAATDAGARVINVSMGGYATGAALDAAIAYAEARGSVIVAAAGNDQASQLAWPAADARVVSVGAVDRAEQQVTFSNSSPLLQLTAPGYGVQTAWLGNTRAYVDGTSAAAPLVSGAVAAVISQNPTLTAQQAVAVLTSTASDCGAPGADPAYGRGILNVGWAMRRNNPHYVDTAIASHSYDDATNEVRFTVQNRSGRPVSGLNLTIGVGGTSTVQSVPMLGPGQIFVARVPARESSSPVTYTSQVSNPTGVVDSVPHNNRRATVLSPPRR